MMNRNPILPLLLTLALVLAPALAASDTNPPAAFKTPVTVDTGPAGMPLDTVLRSLVESIGWVAMTRDVPEETVVIRMPDTPFFEAWSLVFSLYASDLGYAALPGGVMVVGPKEVIAGQFPNALATNTAPKADKPAGPAVQTLELLDADEGRLQEAAKLFPSSATYAVFPNRRLLVVRAEPEAVAQVRRVLEVAGLVPPAQQKPAPRIPHVISVPNLPEDVLQTLRDTFPHAQLRYVASSRKLVVRGLSDEEIDTLRSMVDELLAPAQATAKEDAPAPVEQPEDRVYTLSAISPKDASRLIGFVAPGAQVLVVESVQDAILVKAPPSLHQVIAENLKRYEDLALAKKEEEKRKVEAQAAPPPPPAEVATFPLKGRPAEPLVKALNETFPGVTVVPAGNNLIVKAEPELLDRVRRLLEELTAEPTSGNGQANEPETQNIRRVYTTNYAAPENLLLLAQSTGMFPKGVTPVVDERTTDIFLVGPAPAVEEAAALLAELDRPVPQVELRVQIHQVDSSTAKRLGIDLSAALAPFSVALNPSGLQIGYELGSSALTSLSAVLNTLESKGAAKTLVNTRFLAQDRSPVRLKSGGKLTVLTGGASTTQGEEGGQTTPLSVDYGLEVELTPEIALADGTVTVDVRTNLGGRPIEGTLGTIDIPQKEFEDYVRIKDGQSVVLGGLITTTESNNTNSSPLVSWIPLIGDLFTQRATETSTSELLIILTAKILAPQTASPATVAPEPADTEGGTAVEPAPEEAASPAPAVEDATDAPAAQTAVEGEATPEAAAEAQVEETPPAPEPSPAQPEPAPAPAVESPEDAASKAPAPTEDAGDPLVGAADLPYPYDPLPAYSTFSLRAYPSATPTYGFSLVLPSSSERLCLKGVRIESAAGELLPARLRMRTLNDGGCIEPGSLVVGSLTLEGSEPAARIFFIFEGASGVYVARGDIGG